MLPNVRDCVDFSLGWIFPSSFMGNKIFKKKHCTLNGGTVSISYGFPLKKITMPRGRGDRHTIAEEQYRARLV